MQYPLRTIFNKEQANIRPFGDKVNSLSSDGKVHVSIHEIRSKCGQHGIDLFLYCTHFDKPRIEGVDTKCIRDITKLLAMRSGRELMYMY